MKIFLGSEWKNIAISPKKIVFRMNECISNLFFSFLLDYFSLIIIIFLINCKPFQDRLSLIANIVSEIMISALFFIILMKNILPYFSEDFYFDCCFVSIILLQLGFEYSVSFLSLLINLKGIFIKIFRNASKSNL